MAPLKRPLAVTYVLCVWTIGLVRNCDKHQRWINNRCCNMCPPGTFLKRICTEHKQTECRPCEEGHFMNISTLLDKCHECQKCPYEYAEKCTPTTNVKCACRPGFLCSDDVCSACQNISFITHKPTDTITHSQGSTHVTLLIGYVFLCLSLFVFITSACIKTLRKCRTSKTGVLAVSTNNHDFQLSTEETGLKRIVQDEGKNNNELDELHLNMVDSLS